MYFGVDYYPEQWQRDEWENHAKLMKDGNFNVVRLAEFSWKKLEPKPSLFDFSWLDDAIDILSKHGIKVILGTPTAAPPKWLVNKYDIFMRDSYGRPRGFGSRREYCFNNPYYINETKRIVEKMAEHYKNNENVIGWQIDNEFGCHDTTRCYCEHCRKKFGDWLEKKYNTIENLNDNWGTVFWGLGYDDFNDIILPTYTACEGENARNFSHNPSMDLDFRRFSSDSVIDYQKIQVDIIKGMTDRPITHNLMGHFSDIDYYKLGNDLDFISWDNYISHQWGEESISSTSMAHDLMRGVKNKNFWVMEQQSGPCGWDLLGKTPRPNELRLWTYQAIAHGADGIVYFRFRAATIGMEQYWYGVLDHDGIPRRRYFELQQTGSELNRLEKYLVGAENPCESLIVKSYDNVWAHEIKSHNQNFSYNKLLVAYYESLWKNNIPCDVSSVDTDFSKYKVVYMPAFNLMNDEILKKATDYVQNGGNLVITFRSGTRDDNNNMTTRTLPGYFKDLAGIEVYEFDSLKNGYTVNVSGDILSGTATTWCDIINPTTATTIATYTSEYYKGKSAITVNEYGKGRVFYIGCNLDDNSMDIITSYISTISNIEKTYPINIPNVEIVKRRKDNKEYFIILNHNQNSVDVPFEKEYISLFNNELYSGSINGYGVEIIIKGE